MDIKVDNIQRSIEFYRSQEHRAVKAVVRRVGLLKFKQFHKVGNIYVCRNLRWSHECMAAPLLLWCAVHQSRRVTKEIRVAKWENKWSRHSTHREWAPVLGICCGNDVCEIMLTPRAPKDSHFVVTVSASAFLSSAARLYRAAKLYTRYYYWWLLELFRMAAQCT